MKIKSILAAAALVFAFSASQLFAAAGIISLIDAVEKAGQTVQGKIVDAELERRMFKTVYEVKILDAEGKINHIRVNAETGEIVSASVKKIKEDKARALNTAKIDFAQAKDTALASFPNGRIKEFELDLKSGKVVYEFEILDENGIPFDVVIDAENGEVLLSRQDSVFIGKPAVSLAEAERLALVAVAGSVVYAELEEDDKALHYDVKIVAENRKIYEVRVDGETGRILRTKED